MTRNDPGTEAGAERTGQVTAENTTGGRQHDGILPMSVSEAVAVTDDLKASIQAAENLPELVIAAYTGQAWKPLGHPSWDAYCAAELDTDRLRIPRADRVGIVAEMADAGLSIRAIASATGAARNTVKADLAQVGQSDPPAPRPPVTGTDGKTYQPPPPAPPRAPRRASLPDSAKRAGWEFRKSVERLERIADDDRFAANKEQVAAQWQGHLDFAADVIDHLRDPPERPKAAPRTGPRRKHAAQLDALLVDLQGCNLAFEDLDDFDASVTAEEAARIARDLTVQIRSLNRINKLLEGVGR